MEMKYGINIKNIIESWNFAFIKLTLATALMVHTWYNKPIFLSIREECLPEIHL